MAENPRKRNEHRSSGSPSKGEAIQSRREPRRGDLARGDWFTGPWALDPFSMMRRFSDQMDRWLGEFGTGRDFWSRQGGREGALSMWSPQIETIQRGDQLIVRADLPGLKKDDVNVEVTEEAITIQGERRDEHEEEREGYYRSERNYGSFYRVIPLPEGAISESAKAQFKEGVLEITVQAPPRELSRGRRIQISEGSEAERSDEESSDQSER